MMMKIKINNLILPLLVLGIYACNPKSIPANKSAGKQKIEVMAYYQSSGKLGYLVESIKIEENLLFFNIKYIGGCKPHTFRLIADSSISASKPVQTNLFLVHENNGDNCNDEIKKELIFDIARLKNMGFNPLQLNIDNLNTLTYKYN
jgi:hypothetical protein